MKNYHVKVSVMAVVFVFIGCLLSSPALSESKRPKSKKPCPVLVWTGDYEIHTSKDIKALKGYTKVTGNLTIHGDGGVASLKGLRCLIHVEGDLAIDSSETLTSLKGLNNLRFVGGQLKIGAQFLNNLMGLNNLKSAGSAFITAQGAQRINLKSMRGLEKLKIIKDDLVLFELETLQSLKGLENLKIIGGALVIDDFTLKNLKGLGNLVSVGSIRVYSAILTNFEGLGKIKFIEDLDIGPDGEVSNFKGFHNLKYITGSLHVESAGSLEGLESLKYIGGGLYLNVRCKSEADALKDQLLDAHGIGGEVRIDVNPDC